MYYDWRRIVLGVLALLLLVGGGLWYYFNSFAALKGGQEAACYLVIDRTVSASSEDTVAVYRDAAEKAITGCADEMGALFVGYLDGRLARLQPVGDEAYPVFGEESRNRRIRDETADDAKADARSAIEAVFSQAPGSDLGSDLITAIDQAAGVLQASARELESLDSLFLIVVTDGIHVDPAVNLATVEEDSDIAGLAAQVESLGLVPDLAGVDVSFVGVSPGNTRDGALLPPWYERKVEDFWHNVVESGGGRVCAYAPLPEPGLPRSC